MSIIMEENREFSSKCQICSVPTLTSHYGVRSCEPCKVFFRRYVIKKIVKLTCPFDGQCEININNRHVCSACRFQKCFDVGMSPDLIRGPRGTKQTKTSSRNQITVRQSHQLPTLNLFEQDQSLLTTDQWNLLSNLIHSYDEHTALPVAKNFIKQLDSKPAKMRFKISVDDVVKLCTLFYEQTEPFIRSNQDFNSLSAYDRSIVLHNAVDSVSCLGGGFLLRQSGLISNSAFCQGLENTFGTIPYYFTIQAISLLDENIDLVKLTLSLLAFTTSSSTVFNENPTLYYVQDYRTLLCIQDKYAEMIWKYLLYRYRFDQAVTRFTRLVQCLILAITVKTHLQSVKNHTDAIDCLIEKIEQDQQMNINDN